MKGIVLQMEGVQDCNTPSYINVDLYRNRELQTAHPRRSHPAQTLWRYLRCPTNHIAKRLRATRRSGFLFSPEVSVPYKGNRRGRKDYRRPR